VVVPVVVVVVVVVAVVVVAAVMFLSVAKLSLDLAFLWRPSNFHCSEHGKQDSSTDQKIKKELHTGQQMANRYVFIALKIFIFILEILFFISYT